MPKNRRFISLFQHSSLEFSRDRVAFLVGQQGGGPHPKCRCFGVLECALSIPRMRPVLTTFKSGRALGKSTPHAWAVQEKALVNLEAKTKKGWSCIMQWKSQLGLSCHAEKTYIKESAERLLGKSRYERGELLQQWKTQAEKCSNHYKQNTVQSTSITHERQLRDEEGRDRGGKVRTELAITLMRWFHWPSFHTHIFL